ncbi:MAG: mechanosensitive ion channel [Lachnospiraceae bacterium]|nr:mechanosensitive ion channel [Lachnospiraceae bacterium]
MEEQNTMIKVTADVATSLLNVLLAILLLIVAFVVAAIAKSLIKKLIEKTKLNDLLSKADGENSPPGSTKEYIAKLVYFFVFLLFVPGIFDLIGAGSVTTPIITLLNSIWGFIPNILAACIILTVGLLIAKLVRQLLIPLFSKLRIDTLQEKAGLEVSDTAKLSNTLAYIVYVIIVIPVVIMALQALKVDAITDPAISMLYTVFSFIPNIIVGILIIIVGVIIARFTGHIVERLIAATGVDEKISEMLDGEAAKKLVLSKIVGITVQVVIIIFFAVEGCSILNLGVLTEIGNSVIAYLPKVLAAVLLFTCASFGAAAISKLLKKNGLENFVFTAKTAIYILAAFMILNQLGIAETIVNSAFVLILVAVAIAFAIAFGVGGKEFAAETLKKISTKKEEEKK